MGWNKVQQGSAKKATDIEVGDSITAYLVDVVPSSGYKDQLNLVMQDKDSGERFTLFTAGNLRYLAKDGALNVGQLTKITRKDDEKRKTKAGKSFTLTIFDVQQNDEDTVDVASTTTTADDKRARQAKQAEEVLQQ